MWVDAQTVGASDVLLVLLLISTRPEAPEWLLRCSDILTNAAMTECLKGLSTVPNA
jgi:hypothetical protein